MLRTSLALALSCWLQLGNVVAACEAAKMTDTPLEIRTPALGNDVRLGAGFGIRNHPLLNVPRMHTGVDWEAPIGTPVIAASRGRVVLAGAEGGYGNRVVINHGRSWQTLYAHLATITVQQGDCVEAGTVIGTTGTTGLTTGPILHFEVRCEGQAVDPMSLAVKPKAPSELPISCKAFI